MNRQLTAAAVKDYTEAPPAVQPDLQFHRRRLDGPIWQPRLHRQSA